MKRLVVFALCFGAFFVVSAQDSNLNKTNRRDTSLMHRPYKNNKYRPMNPDSTKVNTPPRMKPDSTSFNTFPLKNDMLVYSSWYIKPVM